MIAEGETAPSFELPAIVDGDIDRIALEDYVGREVVILAFYPGDFNPACRDGTTDLDELDLFTMQKDVSILAISSDSVYAHGAFADAFDLHIPLLSDVRGEVATEYGVAVDDPADDHLVKRAVVVVGLDGTVEFVWATESLTELPPVERVRTSVDSVGGDRTAEARYGVGHAHYVEGRRQFTSAMGAFEDEEWMMARGDFTGAEAEFSDAADEFNTAARFAEDADLRVYFERAEDKAEALWQAAEWLAASADAYASGKGATGVSMREDAEKPLEAARDIHDPVPPEEFPPDEDPADLEAEPDGVSIAPDGEEDDAEATLEIDVDDAAGPDEAVDLGAVDATTGGGAEAESGPPDGATPAGAGGQAPGSDPTADDGDADDRDAGDEGSDDIDEAELEEITAELEQQTDVAEASAAGDASETQSGPDGAGPDTDSEDTPTGSEGIDWDSAPSELGQAGAPSEDGKGHAESGRADADGEGGDTGVTETGDDGADAERPRGEGSEGADIDDDDLELDLTDPSEGEDELLEPEEREVGEDGEAEVLGEDGEEEITGTGDRAVEIDGANADDEAAGNDGGSDDEDDDDRDEGAHGVPDSL
jgi:peroxiredoxin